MSTGPSESFQFNADKIGPFAIPATAPCDIDRKRPAASAGRSLDLSRFAAALLIAFTTKEIDYGTF